MTLLIITLAMLCLGTNLSAKPNSVEQLWQKYSLKHSVFGFSGCISGPWAYIRTADQNGQTRLSVIELATLIERAHYSVIGSGPIFCTDKKALVSVILENGQSGHWQFNGSVRSRATTSRDCLIVGEVKGVPICLRDKNYDGSFELNWHDPHSKALRSISTGALGASEGDIIALPNNYTLFFGIFSGSGESVSLRIFDVDLKIINEFVLPCPSPSFLQIGLQIQTGCGNKQITLSPFEPNDQK